MVAGAEGAVVVSKRSTPSKSRTRVYGCGRMDLLTCNMVMVWSVHQASETSGLATVLGPGIRKQEQR